VFLFVIKFEVKFGMLLSQLMAVITFLLCFLCLVCDFVFFIFVHFCASSYSSAPNEGIVRFRCGGGVIHPFVQIFVKFLGFCIVFSLALGKLYTILISLNSLCFDY